MYYPSLVDPRDYIVKKGVIALSTIQIAKLARMKIEQGF